MGGVDVARINGVEVTSALAVVSEVGADLNSFPSDKQFASWLGLCPESATRMCFLRGITWRRPWEPFNVLIASPPKVRDSPTRKKRNIALNASANSAFAKLAKLLAMLLSIEDRRLQHSGIEVTGLVPAPSMDVVPWPRSRRPARSSR